jgi:predicted nuclease with RNAse H fold
MRYEAVSVDLPWSSQTRSRTAIAACCGSQVVLVTRDLDGRRLPEWIAANAKPGALVVLDVPIEGCSRLSRTVPRRPVDDRFARLGIPILPSYAAGALGARLQADIAARRPDLRVLETYPYAVLRVLWGKQVETGSPRITRTNWRVQSRRWLTWWDWPPRYKRAKSVKIRREALAVVGDLLRACGESYAVISRPGPNDTSAALASLSDAYDAVLGLLAARAAIERSPWSWNAAVPGAAGSIMTIAPPWLRAEFCATCKTSAAGEVMQR